MAQREDSLKAAQNQVLDAEGLRLVYLETNVSVGVAEPILLRVLIQTRTRLMVTFGFY